MEDIVSRTLSVHKEHEVLLKLEAAGLNDELAQKVVDSKGNGLALNVVKMVRDGGFAYKPILKFITTVRVGKVGTFVARDNFQEGKTVNGVSTHRLGNNFKKYLLPKTEHDVKVAELKVHILLTAATDLPREDSPGIIPELAGKHRTRLAYFFHLLAHKQQKKDFTWVVGYICDENNVLWAVDAYWNSSHDGWDVEANSVESPNGWSAGPWVVSR